MQTEWCWRMLAILTLLIAAAGSTEPSLPYPALVLQYASGERHVAVAALCKWPDHRVEDEIGAVKESFRECASEAGDARAGGPACDPETVLPGLSLPAALMLHTDAARVAAFPEVHDDASLALAELLARLPSLSGFSERWFSMRARLARSENEWQQATAWAERGVASFPRSAPLWLLLGSIRETLGTQAASSRSDKTLFAADPLAARSRLTRRGRPRTHLARAERALRAALRLDPALAEARLRLARIAWWRGDLAAARTELRPLLLAGPKDDRATFLAHLFLGRIQEDSGEPREALASYQAAMALDPECQSARIARSFVLRRLGDSAAARAELDTALGRARTRVRPDPYWLYLAPAADAAARDLAALRREATH